MGGKQFLTMDMATCFRLCTCMNNVHENYSTPESLAEMQEKNEIATVPVKDVNAPSITDHSPGVPQL